MNIARIGNKYLADTEPWKVVKTDPARVETILNIALQITANTAIAIEPFMPFSAEKILRMLAVGKFGWERLGAMDLIPAGHAIGEPALLFEKIEDDVIQRQLDKLAATKAANEAAEVAQNIEPQKDTIQFDDFQKMDIRVSTILAAEKVAKTKKLLKLTIDTGIDKREIAGARPGESRSARTEGYSFERYDSDGGGCFRKTAPAATRRGDPQRGCCGLIVDIANFR